MGFRDTAEKHDALLAQLNEERAAALARISSTLESLIAELVEAQARLATATGDARARELARFRDLRRRAVRYRWYLEVQREALGFRRHELLEELYPIPAPVES